jgi:hypothetical protein
MGCVVVLHLRRRPMGRRFNAPSSNAASRSPWCRSSRPQRQLSDAGRSRRDQPVGCGSRDPRLLGLPVPADPTLSLRTRLPGGRAEQPCSARGRAAAIRRSLPIGIGCRQDTPLVARPPCSLDGRRPAAVRAAPDRPTSCSVVDPGRGRRAVDLISNDRMGAALARGWLVVAVRWRSSSSCAGVANAAALVASTLVLGGAGGHHGRDLG